jgi:hypothetical protein
VSRVLPVAAPSKRRTYQRYPVRQRFCVPSWICSLALALCREVRNVSAEDAQLALAALLALNGPRPETGARALLALFDALVLIEAAAVVEDWLRRRPAQ